MFRDISGDILAHWMDLLNTEGWIPRQVLLVLLIVMDRFFKSFHKASIILKLSKVKVCSN